MVVDAIEFIRWFAGPNPCYHWPWRLAVALKIYEHWRPCLDLFFFSFWWLLLFVFYYYFVFFSFFLYSSSCCVSWLLVEIKNDCFKVVRNVLTWSFHVRFPSTFFLVQFKCKTSWKENVIGAFIINFFFFIWKSHMRFSFSFLFLWFLSSSFSLSIWLNSSVQRFCCV